MVCISSRSTISPPPISNLFKRGDGFLEVASRSIKGPARTHRHQRVHGEPGPVVFRAGGKRLSADVVKKESSSSVSGKPEGHILTESYRPDIIVMRHPRGSVAWPPLHQRFGGERGGRGDTSACPSLQPAAVRQLRGLKVAIVGDILRSRVARSDLFGFRKMGIEVRLVSPPL